MFAFFKRRSRGGPEAASPERALIADFEALDPARRDAAALELLRLWTWFNDEFEGTASFVGRPEAEQDAYIDKLAHAAARSESLKSGDLGRFYYSSAMLSLFMRSLRAGDASSDALALSARVAWMINHARQLDAARQA